MKLVIDTCVLYPTVMREMVLGAASLGHFAPVWSARILEEWRRAALRLGPEGAAQAEAEIALLRSSWPGADAGSRIGTAEGLERRLWLPDPGDIHVLALAVACSADGIMTLNAKDFPRNVLAEEGVIRVDPDGFLHGLWLRDPEGLACVGKRVLSRARSLSGRDWQMRPLLKKARLPRLARALEQ